MNTTTGLTLQDKIAIVLDLHIDDIPSTDDGKDLALPFMASPWCRKWATIDGWDSDSGVNYSNVKEGYAISEFLDGSKYFAERFSEEKTVEYEDENYDLSVNGSRIFRNVLDEDGYVTDKRCVATIYDFIGVYFPSK